MTDEAMIEAMARAIAKSEEHIAAGVSLPVLQAGVFWKWAESALTSLQPFLTELKQEIRREALGEAADRADKHAKRVAELARNYPAVRSGASAVARDMANELRALSKRPVPTEETK